jgi:hypothetical protein
MKQPKQKLIYIAHPYGGNPENYLLAEHYLTTLTEAYPQYCFISPVIAYSSLYNEMPYDDGLSLCLTLLSRCDELWLCQDTQGKTKSKGTNIEVDYCKQHNIPVVIKDDI